MKKHFMLRFIVLSVLLAIAAIGASAQTQTAADTTTPAAVPTDPVLTSGAPVFPKPAVLPAQGASGTKDSYVWVRGYIFKVHRSNGNPAYINVNPATGNASSIVNFDYGTERAFKIEAGWNSSTTHFGFRLAYFRSTQKADTSATQTAAGPGIISPQPLNVLYTGFPVVGTTATFQERFRLHVVDIEGTYKWGGANQSIVISAGLRVAPNRQIYQARDIFLGTPELVEYTQRRTGVGPTVGVDLRHYLGSGFWVTGAGRFAALFGSIREQARYDNAPFFVETATRKSNRMTPVFEGEGGLEWSGAGGGGFFVNGSFIIHHWQNLVNVMPTPAVGTDAFASLDNPGNPPTRKGNVRFIGGAFSVGFRF